MLSIHKRTLNTVYSDIEADRGNGPRYQETAPYIVQDQNENRRGGFTTSFLKFTGTVLRAPFRFLGMWADTLGRSQYEGDPNNQNNTHNK